MPFGRRTLLSSLPPLAGAAFAGCSRDRASSPPALRFVGQNPAVGHLLRQPFAGFGGEVPQRTRVLIVGAGVAGTSAAWRLARAGFDDFIVLEMDDEPGGTARAGSFVRSAYPMGAHYLPAPHPELAELHLLLRDLGIITGRDAADRPQYDPTMVCSAPVERHFYQGVWYDGLYPAAGETRSEAEQWQRFLEHLRTLAADDRQGERAFRIPVQRCSLRHRELDRISMATHLDRLGLDSWRLRWLVDYSCRDDYGCTAAQVSAFAGLHHFLARGFDDAREDFLLTWPNGNAELVARMAKRSDLGSRLRRNTLVRAIDQERGLVATIDVTSGRKQTYAADVILFAAPRFLLARLLSPRMHDAAATALTYTPWRVSAIEVAKAPGGVGAPLCWDNVAIDAAHLGYVVANHGEAGADAIRPGAVLVFYEPFLADDPATLLHRRRELLDTPLASQGEAVLAALERMHPGLRADIRAIDIARWGHAMVRPEPGLLFGDALSAARRPMGRVLPCATDVAGLPLFEEAFMQGLDAARFAADRLNFPLGELS